MLSRSRELVVDSGSRVFIDCEFHMHNLSMFDNPIVWEKEQLGESTVLNIMGVVQEPFATTRRYDIVLLAQPPRYRLRLKIKGRVQIQVLTRAQRSVSFKGSGTLKARIAVYCTALALNTKNFPVLLLLCLRHSQGWNTKQLAQFMALTYCY